MSATRERKQLHEGDKYIDHVGGHVCTVVGVQRDDGTFQVETTETSLALTRDLDRAEEALADGGGAFTHEDDVNTGTLTEVKGVGPATALEIVAETGMRTATALAATYMTEDAETVAGVVGREDYLREWIQANPEIVADAVDGLTTDQGRAAIRVMSFLREFDATIGSDVNVDAAPTKGEAAGTNIDGQRVLADHVEWFTDDGDFGGVVTEPKRVAAITWGDGEIGDYFPNTPYDVDAFVENDDGHYTLTCGEGESMYSREYVERIASVFGVEPADLTPHLKYPEKDEDEWPLAFDPAADVTALLGPRIMP